MDEAARPRRELRRAEHRLTYLPGGYLSAYPARLRAVPAWPPGGCAAGARHGPAPRRAGRPDPAVHGARGAARPAAAIAGDGRRAFARQQSQPAGAGDRAARRRAPDERRDRRSAAPVGGHRQKPPQAHL